MLVADHPSVALAAAYLNGGYASRGSFSKEAARPWMRLTGTAGPLNERQIEAIVLLSSGTPPNEVLAQVGIDRRTWWRWSQSPHFMAAVRSVVDASLTTASAFFSTKLVGVLAQLLKEVREAETPRDRIRAAEVYVNVLQRVQAMGQGDMKAIGRTISLVFQGPKAIAPSIEEDEPPIHPDSSGSEGAPDVPPA